MEVSEATIPFLIDLFFFFFCLNRYLLVPTMCKAPFYVRVIQKRMEDVNLTGEAGASSLPSLAWLIYLEKNH